MGDSTEKNLKSYRNSELKWFLLANILLMLVTSGELKFDSQDANVFSFISEIISITAVSSCAYILTFIFDSILPPIFKVKLIFWWKKQPSCTIFTDMLATVYKGNIIKNLIMDCQSYTKYRPNETTGGIFVSWRRKEELPTGA